MPCGGTIRCRCELFVLLVVIASQITAILKAADEKMMLPLQHSHKQFPNHQKALHVRLSCVARSGTNTAQLIHQFILILAENHCYQHVWVRPEMLPAPGYLCSLFPLWPLNLVFAHSQLVVTLQVHLTFPSATVVDLEISYQVQQ